MNILKKITRKIANYINRVKAIKPVCKEIKKSMDHFLSDKEKNNSWLRWSIGWDIWRCRWKYQSTPNEYFLFGFRGKGHDYRNSFITDIVKDNTLLSLIGGDLFRKELKNKYSFYQILGKFFNREAIFVDFTDNADQIKFKRFALSHKDIFVKENASSCGRGVSCCHIETEKDADELFDSLKEMGGQWIVEEKLVQVPEMAQWNESSVNTVRLPAILNNGKWTPLGPFLRTGRKGAVVDNAGSGGVFAVIDPQSGVVNTDGVDEDGKYYAKHPDSGITYKGWQVPRWDELLALAEKIQRSIPQHKYVGWDFALTEKGWTLIEGNWGQFVSQYNNHIGLKNRFFELLGLARSK